MKGWLSKQQDSGAPPVMILTVSLSLGWQKRVACNKALHDHYINDYAWYDGADEHEWVVQELGHDTELSQDWGGGPGHDDQTIHGQQGGDQVDDRHPEIGIAWNHLKLKCAVKHRITNTAASDYFRSWFILWVILIPGSMHTDQAGDVGAIGPEDGCKEVEDGSDEGHLQHHDIQLLDHGPERENNSLALYVLSLLWTKKMQT